MDSHPHPQLQSQSRIQTQSHSSVRSSVRPKMDPAWQYVHAYKDGDTGKMVYICGFCDKVVRGGGINRMKRHFSGVQGDVESCKKVLADVRFTMKSILKENEVKAQAKTSGFEDDIEILDVDAEVVETQLQKKNHSRKEKRQATSNLHPLFAKGCMMLIWLLQCGSMMHVYL